MIRCSRVGQHIEYAGKSQREGMKISTILQAYIAGGAVSLKFSVKQIFPTTKDLNANNTTKFVINEKVPPTIFHTQVKNNTHIINIICVESS